MRNLKLTRKQKAFADTLINNPKISATKAALQTYGKPGKPTSVGTAAVIATENLTKPNVLMYLDKHDFKAQQALVEGLEAERSVYRFNGESKSYELVGTEKDHNSRLRAADSILDRLHGKATQRVEQHSTSVNLNLSLSDLTQEQ